MRRFSIAGLRVWLLLLVPLAVLPALGLALYNATEQRRQAAAEVQTDTIQLARLAATSYEQLIEATHQLLIVLAEVPSVQGRDQDACQALLTKLLKQYRHYANLGAADTNGDVFCSALPAPGPTNVADRNYVRRAVETRRLAIGEYQIGRIVGNDTVNLGYPILDAAGQPQGVVAAALDLAWLNQLAARAQLPPGSTLTVADHAGTILARYPDPGQWVGKLIPEADVRDAMLGGREGWIETSGSNGVRRLFAFAPLSGAAGESTLHLGVGVPTAVAFADADAMLARNLTVVALVALLALAAAWLGGNIIAERRRIEQQVLRSQRMEAIGQLAGGIAHDFNNLLTVINGFSEFVLFQLDPDSPHREAIEQIQKAGERAVGLTRQLLAFSRRQVLEPRVVDLNALIADLDPMLRRVLGEDVDLATALNPALGRVKADPAQLEQVIMNLVVNARDAMPRGGKLAIETANLDVDRAYRRDLATVRAGRYILLVVSDTGIGMDAATVARIFEPFFTTKEQGRGTGLGLATVYGIVKQSNGYIWVYSEPGRGTTFKIYLPRVEEAAAELHRPGDRPAGSFRGSEVVLVIEDDEALRALLRRALEASGYTVLEATRDHEALTIAERHDAPIHLLLADVVLPGLSGPELGTRLTMLRPGLKVLYMSGYTEPTLVRHGVSVEGGAFLSKPFTADALARKVREVLDEERSP